MQENNELQMNTEEQADFKKQPKNSKTVSNIYDIVSVVVSAVAVIAIVFTFVTRVLVVSGASMNPTLNNGDTVAISSLKRSFDYGDIVIVAQPNAMHKTLQAAYAHAALTWNRFCATGSVSDFRAHNRYRTGDYVRLADPRRDGDLEFPWPAVAEIAGREQEFL